LTSSLFKDPCFQGYYFCRPEMAERHEIPAYKMNYLRILQIANQPELDGGKLAAAIRQEASLVYRLLRYLNSPAFTLRTKVDSIPHALTLLGERDTRKWISLVAVAEMGSDKPHELVLVPLPRARFCELLAEAGELRNRANDLFLMGLLSALDAIMDLPMSSVLADIPVQQEIKEALFGQAGRFALF